MGRVETWPRLAGRATWSAVSLALGWIALAALAACGGGGGGGGGPVSQLLFYEDFAGAHLQPGWEIVRPDVVIDPYGGDPPPCLRLLPPSLTDDAWIRAIPEPHYAWDTPGGVRALVLASFMAGSSSGYGQIEILDVDMWAPGVHGQVASVGASGSWVDGIEVEYAVLAEGGWWYASEWLPPDDGFHDYGFVVWSDGSGGWLRDGVIVLDTYPELVPTAWMGIDLRSFFGMDSAFDEVEVRRP